MNIFQEYRYNGIYIKHAIDELPQDSSFPMHVHQSYEIYLFVRGNVKYLVEGTSYDLFPGSVLIIRPSESHKPKIIASSPYERYNINFRSSVIETIDPELRLLAPFLSRDLGRNNLFCAAELSGIPIERMFFNMCYSTDDTYGKQMKIKACLFYILDAIKDAYGDRKSATLQSRSREEQIVAYINERLNTDLTIPKIADQFYLSTSQLNRVFKSATGASPWEYITIKRLSLARDRIRSGRSVAEAFAQSGYGDYSAFYRAYVRHYGKSPTEEKRRGR